jgi:hypothetical protein
VPNVAYLYLYGVLLSVTNPILLWEKQYKITVPNAELLQPVPEDPLSIRPHATACARNSRVGTLTPACHFFDNVARY